MNKRNFGRVIKRIEQNIAMWNQMTPPGFAERELQSKGACKTPYCFLGHAEFIRTSGKHVSPKKCSTWQAKPLAKWLGLSLDELDMTFTGKNTLDDFKRWHKAGKVS